MTQSINKTGMAAYRRIEESLRGKIRQGHWPAGAMLPGRRSLALEYGVSVMTIERAITQLVADGILFADDRRGTFVTGKSRISLGSAGVRDEATLKHLQRRQSGQPPQASRSNVTGTVGIIAHLYLHNHDHLELHNFWMRLMLQSLERSFSEDGKRTFFFNRVRMPGQPLIPINDAIQAVKDEGVEAIAFIGLGLDPQEIDSGFGRLTGLDLPMVCITSGELRCQIPHVFYDNYSAGYQAAQHLLEHGHRDILFLAPFTASWITERLDGVRAAVEFAHLPADTIRVYPPSCGAWVQEEDPYVAGVTTAKQMLADNIRPSSIICINDGVALGVLETLSSSGLRPSLDFAIIGFDDHPQARSSGLTTMRPPMEDMGKEAGRLLQCAMHGEQPSHQVRLRWHLVPRASTQELSAECNAYHDQIKEQIE
jgi:DNA-binding LacI/PurR family transcriptional regulator/DNA-binding transcriptional regulator YhcF (GntR family)